MTLAKFRIKYAFVLEAVKAAFPGANIRDGTANYDSEYAVCFAVDGVEQCFRCEVVVREGPAEFEDDEVMPAGGWDYQIIELSEERLQTLILRAKQRIEKRGKK